HLTHAQLGPGILMFFASDGGTSWTDVDHVGIYMGNGWMMHSTGGGPQLQYVGSGYYYDHFVYGRQLKASSAPGQPPKVPGVGLAGLPVANSVFVGDRPLGPHSRAPSARRVPDHILHRGEQHAQAERPPQLPVDRHEQQLSGLAVLRHEHDDLQIRELRILPHGPDDVPSVLVREFGVHDQ